jgi:hypothetical protein
MPRYSTLLRSNPFVDDEISINLRISLCSIEVESQLLKLKCALPAWRGEAVSACTFCPIRICEHTNRALGVLIKDVALVMNLTEVL